VNIAVFANNRKKDLDTGSSGALTQIP
jgi:hypothetical protein